MVYLSLGGGTDGRVRPPGHALRRARPMSIIPLCPVLTSKNEHVPRLPGPAAQPTAAEGSAPRNCRTAVVPPAMNQSSPLTRTTSVAPPAASTIALPGSQSHSGQLCWNQQPSSPSATRPRSHEPEPNMRNAAADVAAACQGMAHIGSASHVGWMYVAAPSSATGMSDRPVPPEEPGR